MTEKIISQEELKKILAGLLKDSEVIAPVKEGELVLFQAVRSVEEILFDYTNPLKPVKEFFFPAREELFKHEISESLPRARRE